jgi:hypothetical protein
MIAVNIMVLLNMSGYTNIEYFQDAAASNNVDASGNKIDASGNVIDASGNVSSSNNSNSTTTNTNEKKENEGDLTLDTKESFLEAYRSLTPDQVAGLNTDTKQLIQTQQQLLETLKNMGPALKEGQTILNTFKQYFGSDQDLGGTIETLKNI